MLKAGVTGGIGSGKTLVCSILEKLGIPVYYADTEARRLMNQQEELRLQITDLLGKEAYSGGELNRQYVASRVFGKPVELEALNALVHPAVHEDFHRWAQEQKDAPCVVEEAALLFESGGHKMLDMTVLVLAPTELRIERVMKRDGLEREAVELRIQHQMDEDAKKKLASSIIYNDDSGLLLPRVVHLHQQMINSV